MGHDGIHFLVEDDMLPVVCRSAATGAFGAETDDVVTSEKTAVGAVIPDLLFGVSRRRISLPQSWLKPLTHFECAVLSQVLSEKRTTQKLLARDLFAAESQIRSATITLLRRGLVRSLSGNAVIVPVPSKIPRISIISIEAKLTRWADAIEQAREYKNFSNAAYVAMPKTVLERNLTIKKHCVNGGVGLIAVADSAIEFWHKVKWNKNRSAKWLWVADKLTLFSRAQPHHPKAKTSTQVPANLRNFVNASSQAA